MMIWLIVILYLVIAYFAYNKEIKTWNNKLWEKIIFSLIWILALPLYAIWWLHKNG